MKKMTVYSELCFDDYGTEWWTEDLRWGQNKEIICEI